MSLFVASTWPSSSRIAKPLDDVPLELGAREKYECVGTNRLLVGHVVTWTVTANPHLVVCGMQLDSRHDAYMFAAQCRTDAAVELRASHLKSAASMGSLRMQKSAKQHLLHHLHLGTGRPPKPRRPRQDLQPLLTLPHGGLPQRTGLAVWDL